MKISAPLQTAFGRGEKQDSDPPLTSGRVAADHLEVAGDIVLIVKDHEGELLLACLSFRQRAECSLDLGRAWRKLCLSKQRRERIKT